ncbi:hypothetical protein ACNKHS_23185 [Shigella flexneri]
MMLSVFRGVAACFFQRNLVKGQLIFALTVISSKVMVLCFSQRLDKESISMAARHAVQNVRFQHGVKGDTPQLNAIILQNTAVVLQVLPRPSALSRLPESASAVLRHACE